MKPKTLVRNPVLLLGPGIVVLTALLGVAVYYRWINVRMDLGPFPLHHWMSWTGATFIAIFNPVYAVWKRRSLTQYSRAVTTHVIGNLLAFTLISVHFAHHLGRPPQAEPEGNTGLVMYLSVMALVVTGFILRFRLVRQGLRFVRYVHSSFITTFYIIVVVHMLVGLGMI